MAKAKDQVTIRQWISLKPYQTYDNYDLQYLKLSQEVYVLLKEKYKEILTGFGLDGDVHLQQFSCIVVSYFEDFISEIGIWKAFTDLQTERYGSALPFYDLAEYDTEYLNPQDLAFLSWFFLIELFHNMLPIDFDLFLDMGDDLYELLEPKIEDYPTTDFYDTFLKVEADDSYESIWQKTDWLAWQSYLTGWKTTFRYSMEIGKYLDEQVQSGEMMNEAYLLNMKREYATKPTSLGAIQPVNWLSRIARASKSVKQQIEQIQKQHVGLFQYERSDTNAIVFKNLLNQKSYSISRSSLPENADFRKEGHVSFFYLAQWGNYWHLDSEIFEHTDDSAKKIIAKIVTPKHVMSATALDRLVNEMPILKACYQAHFKSPLIIFETTDAAKEALEEFNDFTQNYLDQGNGPAVSGDFHSLPPLFYSTGDDPEDSLGIFFSEEFGIQLIPDIVTLLQVLEGSQQPDTELEAGGFQILAYQYCKELINYFNSQFGEVIYQQIIEELGGEPSTPIDFFARFHFPEQYDARGFRRPTQILLT